MGKKKLTWMNETRRLSDLLPWERNPRQIGKAEAARLAGSREKFDQPWPLVIGPGGELYDGHQRLKVWGEEYGYDIEVAVRVASRPLTEKERQELVILAHKGTVAGWDWDELASWGVEEKLLEWGFEPEELGFDLTPEPTPDPGAQVDKAAELQEKWRVERGQVWEVGRHRLMCGDSTCAEDVERLMDGAEPHNTITDPPYGVEYDPAWRQRAAEEGLLSYADRRVGEVKNDDRVDWTDAFMLALGPVVYCWHAGRLASSTQLMLEASGFEMRSQIVWSKPHFPISRGHYHWRHEPCWYAVRRGCNAGWIGDRQQTTVWEITLDKNVEGGHGTQKPVGCFTKPLHNHEGDCYDPFLGSGTMLVACEQLGRRGFGMEIESKYCSVALERLSQMGLEPRLLG